MNIPYSLKRILKNLSFLLPLFLLSCGQQSEEKEVIHVYNWTDYIAEDVIAEFENQSKVEVVYDVFDSNEVLEAKLLAGNTGFDVVVPSSDFMSLQIEAGVFQPLDKSLLPNFKHLDPELLKHLDAIDPNNQYGIPYLWLTTGIGYNVQKVKAILGENAPLDSWDLLFKPEILSQLHPCGVAFLDSPSEVLPAVLHYLGKDPNSFVASDYEEAEKVMAAIRPYITYFHSSKYMNDLANGNICVVLAWSGDVFQASERAAEANSPIELGYSIPKEGAALSFDMLAIPKDAPHVKNAHAFINFLMEPAVIAKVTNYTSFANGNMAATAAVDKEILDNPAIYPSEAVKKKLYTFKRVPPNIERVRTRAWTRIKTGQ